MLAIHVVLKLVRNPNFIEIKAVGKKKLMVNKLLLLNNFCIKLTKWMYQDWNKHGLQTRQERRLPENSSPRQPARRFRAA